MVPRPAPNGLQFHFEGVQQPPMPKLPEAAAQRLPSSQRLSDGSPHSTQYPEFQNLAPRVAATYSFASAYH
ncbi:hypothetical protein E4U26_005900 [Claviceps purpurea]|nr:hypothetical protein E4U26_005900 [Claviceps purpurea]